MVFVGSHRTSVLFYLRKVYVFSSYLVDERPRQGLVLESRYLQSYSQSVIIPSGYPIVGGKVLFLLLWLERASDVGIFLKKYYGSLGGRGRPDSITRDFFVWQSWELNCDVVVISPITNRFKLTNCNCPPGARRGLGGSHDL